MHRNRKTIISHDEQLLNVWEIRLVVRNENAYYTDIMRGPKIIKKCNQMPFQCRSELTWTSKDYGPRISNELTRIFKKVEKKTQSKLYEKQRENLKCIIRSHNPK